jgi:hypothetical protein
MRKFIIAAITTALLMLFFERPDMGTTNIDDPSADLQSLRPER